MARRRPRKITFRVDMPERSTLAAAAALNHESVSETIRRLALAGARAEIQELGNRRETEADEEIEPDAMDTPVEAAADVPLDEIEAREATP